MVSLSIDKKLQMQLQKLQWKFAHWTQQLKGLKEENEETFEETEKVPAFPYYPVDSSVLNNIVGSVQARKVPKI